VNAAIEMHDSEVLSTGSTSLDSFIQRFNAGGQLPPNAASVYLRKGCACQMRVNSPNLPTSLPDNCWQDFLLTSSYFDWIPGMASGVCYGHDRRGTLEPRNSL
jgi:hypothetical protein